MKKYLFVFLWLLMGISLKSQPTPQNLELLDHYFSSALAEWEVPGLAIAIVQNDSIIFAKGYGVTDVTTRQPVNANTLFAVASNTKAYTATALAMLVDEGKLQWTDKVQKYLPWFRLYDPYVSSNITIADLLSHRSGLATFSGDLIWYGSNYNRRQVIEKAAFLKPHHGFREEFGYSNILYLTAGEIIPVVTGQSWDEFVEQRILQPLGMKRSVLHVSELALRDNVAQPHTTVDGKTRSIPWLSWDNIAPAGSLISSANEMANWLIMNLNEGTFQNKKLINPERVYELQSAQTPNAVAPSAKKLFPSTHFKAYGFGWGMMDYLGYKIVQHNGGYDGMVSQTTLIPEKKLGFVVLTNSNSNLYFALMYKMLDVLLENPTEQDWSKITLERMKKNELWQKETEAKKAAERNKNSRPSHPLTDFVGMYACPLYDSVEVKTDGKDLYLSMMHTPDFQGKLSHWQYDSFRVEFPASPSLPAGIVTFFTNRDGKVDRMEIFIENPDFDFTEFELRKQAR
ncbi:MAG: serine hydrolase [Bacteroidales bacterium]|nr:serine hydrolase [Bacteroidales bacterium]